jgi:outer membrane protein OmpA-like peptidoglycan-associated protein
MDRRQLGGFEEFDNPWPALSDLLAATTLIFLVLFAVIAVPALQAKGRMTQISNTLDVVEASVKRDSFVVKRVGDYLLVTIKGDAVFPKDDFDLHTLKPEGQHQLRRLAVSLSRDSVARRIDQVQIVGHTSREGGDEHNLRLSSQRAATVAFFLIREAALPACQVTALGRGPFYPLNPARARTDTTPNPLDRRIEIEIRTRLVGDTAQDRRRRDCVDDPAVAHRD